MRNGLRFVCRRAWFALIAVAAGCVSGCVSNRVAERQVAFGQWMTAFPLAIRDFRTAEGRWPDSGAELAASAKGTAFEPDPVFLRQVRFDPREDGSLVTVWSDGEQYLGYHWRWEGDQPVTEKVGVDEMRRVWRGSGAGGR